MARRRSSATVGALTSRTPGGCASPRPVLPSPAVSRSSASPSYRVCRIFCEEKSGALAHPAAHSRAIEIQRFIPLLLVLDAGLRLGSRADGDVGIDRLP